MRIDVRGLEAFFSIAERGSFRAAASHLNLSQTALSHRIRKLEEALGTQLLLRTTRQVTLTPAGAALLPKARRLFEDMESAINDLRSIAGDGEERLAIGCLPTVATQCLPRAVAAFARLRPGIQIKVFDNSASEIAERVQAGDAEFGITIVAANRSDLELKPIVKEPFVLVCHHKSPLAKSRTLTWAQLRGAPLVRVSAETGNRVLIDDALGSRRDSLSWRYEVQRVGTAVSMVRAGAVAAIVPRLGFDAAAEGGVVAIPLRSPTVTRTLGVVTRKGVPLKPLSREFLQHATEALRGSFA